MNVSAVTDGTSNIGLTGLPTNTVMIGFLAYNQQVTVSFSNAIGNQYIKCLNSSGNPVPNSPVEGVLYYVSYD